MKNMPRVLLTRDSSLLPYEVVLAARTAGVVTPKIYTYALVAVRRNLHLKEIRTFFGEDLQSHYSNRGYFAPEEM